MKRKLFTLMLKSLSLFGLALVLFASKSSASADSALQKIEVFPSEIHLETARDRQSIVVQAAYADGITRDVTKEATFTLAREGLVVRENAVFQPKTDGATTLAVGFGGQTVNVPVKVARATENPPLSFRLDVMPVFMRAGCNTGSCHGAARGKDGFRISLFGFDPEGDHFRLTREMIGRRINLAVPADSTLLEKATGAVQHTGGKRFEKDSELYYTLHRWIEAGAANDDASKLPKVVAVDLYPKTAVLDGKGSTQQMTVRATYSDGTDRDVTSLAVFLTNNETSAAVSPDGLVTAGDRGEAFVMARFETYTVGSQVLTLPKGLQFTYPDEAKGNYIDDFVAAKLKKIRVSPSELCDDQTFVRRVYLDVVGLLPNRAESEAFLVSADPEKRAKLVDELLTRKEFTEIWVNQWAEMLQIRTTNENSYKSMFLYYNWLVEKVGKNTPMDQMVRELLGASGGTFKSPASNFYQISRETLPLAENVAQVFMGMRIQCAVPQPSFRPLDAERLLQLRRVLFANRQKARRGLSRDDRLQLGRRRGEPSRRRRRDEAEIPGRRYARDGRQRPTHRACRMARKPQESLVRGLVREPSLGALHGHWRRRARRRFPGLEPFEQPRASRRAWQALYS